MPPSLLFLMPLSNSNQLKVSSVFQEKNYLPTNIYLKIFYINGIRRIHFPVPCFFCYLCLIRSFCISIYRNTSFFLMTAWYSNVWMCYKCSNVDELSGYFQYFTVAKPYCSKHICTYEIILKGLIPSNKIARSKDIFHFQFSNYCQIVL